MIAVKGIFANKGISGINGLRGNVGIAQGGAVWTPASVAGLNFGFEVSDTDTITTDLSGTTPVTADGDLVRYVGDLSVNGYNATQAVDSRRATYNTNGTYHWLTFAGNNDISFDLNPAHDGAVDSDNWACFGVRVTGASGRYIIGNASDDGFGILFANGLLRPVVDTTSGTIVGTGTTNNTNNDVVVSVEWNRAAGTLKGWINGVLEVNLSGTPANKLVGTSAWLGQGFSATAAEFAGRMYTGWEYTTIPSDADKLRIEKYVAAKMGVTL